ncbi:hypothetical protein [Novosphingobium endophyticum]|uniref:hypothetical protein n=1 Tax=Novosphingobium endophyticum TaxID=1955250 RepID=UPI001E5782E9|nr:hypothetical protein [Novosphingobium endophyticum]
MQALDVDQLHARFDGERQFVVELGGTAENDRCLAPFYPGVDTCGRLGSGPACL